MEKRQEILNELNSIAPLLAKVSAKMPYTLPAAYFEELPNKMVSLLNVPEKEIDLPIQQHPFTVPEGYFESLAGSIIQKIKEEEQGFSINAKEMPYSIPTGYFEDFATTVLQKTRAEEVKTELVAIAPLLSEIPKTNVYTTPSGYFDTLTVSQATTTKVVKMGSSWIKYAAAAVIVGVLAIGAFIVAGKNSNDNNFGTAAYKKAINTNIDTAVQNMNDKELEKFLADNIVVVTLPGEDVEKGLPELNELMNLISDEELQQSLNEQSVVESSGS
jgi:hypothetical protein